MPCKKTICFFVFISFLYSNGFSQMHHDGQQIIPIPTYQTSIEGTFELDSSTGLHFDADFKLAAEFLKFYIETGSSIQLKKNNVITIIKDETIKSPEGYKLEILPKQIKISANSNKGAFYAVQTLRQLLPPSLENRTFIDNRISIPCQTIEDAPQFPYRGMHLDVARHMFPVNFIKKYIDAMALLKLNMFHWHLTDDQGWRIEIKKYPKLQEIAAFRNETLIGHYNTFPQQYDGKRYGGFYTQEEIKEIAAYADERFITIIPEIEMPGHSQAAIAAYPELGCTGNQVVSATKWGVFEEVYCPKEETFVFLENVLDEVLELFPSKYIHIGGDEAPKTHWKTCDVCQQNITDLGLKDEQGLQSYFISRIENYLNKKGRDIIGWDEILEGGLAPNATVMSWRGTNGAIEAAKQHHNVILTPNSHLYFDYYQSDNEDEPLAIGGYVPLEKVYEFNPIPVELSQEESKYVLGAQANLWTEYIPNPEQVEYMVFPRMLALSEVVWSKPENKYYTDFVRRTENFHQRLDALDINYANHLFEVEGQLSSHGYELKTLTTDKTIRYTLDKTEPNPDSRIYVNPIPINQNTFIKAAVFRNEKQLGGIFTQDIQYHKAVGKTITLNVPPHKAYPGSGPEGLINGVSGSPTRYGDKEWLGFWGDDLEITIDLGEEMEINSIETRFYHAPGQWIYAPNPIKVTFDNGKALFPEFQNSLNSIQKVSLQKALKSRYLKFRIKNYGTIPEGNQGAGNKAWTFIDEIIIK